MPRGRRGVAKRAQVNVPLGDEHWHIALVQLTIRDGKSVPELLRPVVIAYIKRQLAADPKLVEAVRNIEESRDESREKVRKRKQLADVTPLTKPEPQRRRKGPSRASDSDA